MQTRLTSEQIKTYKLNSIGLVEALHRQSHSLTKIQKPLNEIVKLFKNEGSHPEHLTVECISYYLGRILKIAELSPAFGVLVEEDVKELAKRMGILDQTLKVSESITSEIINNENQAIFYPSFSFITKSKPKEDSQPSRVTTSSFFKDTKISSSITNTNAETKITQLLQEILQTPSVSYDNMLNDIDFNPPSEKLHEYANVLTQAGLTIKIIEKETLLGIIDVPARLKVKEEAAVILEKLNKFAESQSLLRTTLANKP